MKKVEDNYTSMPDIDPEVRTVIVETAVLLKEASQLKIVRGDDNKNYCEFILPCRMPPRMSVQTHSAMGCFVVSRQV